jgi:hypothetical protein
MKATLTKVVKVTNVKANTTGSSTLVNNAAWHLYDSSYVIVNRVGIAIFVVVTNLLVSHEATVVSDWQLTVL